jgi:hypothetical protein
MTPTWRRAWVTETALMSQTGFWFTSPFTSERWIWGIWSPNFDR